MARVGWLGKQGEFSPQSSEPGIHGSNVMKIWFIPKTQGGARQRVCTTEDALCRPSAKLRAGASLTAFADAAQLRAEGGGAGPDRTASGLLPGRAGSNSLAVSLGTVSCLRGEGGVLHSSGSQSGVLLAEVAASSWELVRNAHSLASGALGAGPAGLSPPGDSDVHLSLRSLPSHTVGTPRGQLPSRQGSSWPVPTSIPAPSPEFRHGDQCREARPEATLLNPALSAAAPGGTQERSWEGCSPRRALVPGSWAGLGGWATPPSPSSLGAPGFCRHR